ncbi:hypothetical protein [Halothiobacillus neapolitanus]|uniref:Uncharacterized protein n=1 Tax=Halothiobacillus neapolitanus (strain ATCC 23641 / DSM 15147 / CIP 104769 / NCIMB 8539 / c2) TaxID=555778 RepID=D0L0X3_HALNC|nr:hypothetical protein [Halothiobacillus neapolitanus]ACX96346.1 conserved hypothetical protein [Halothiobacillus neapolitanus c2]TDN66660.1 hypothetical protein C8D83_101999 [Halothiobacillus neapolitanus]
MNSSELPHQSIKQAQPQPVELETDKQDSFTQADQAGTRRPTPFLTTRKLWAFALIAALAASTMAFHANHLNYDDLLVRIQAENGLGYLGEEVLQQPPLVQAQLLSYSKNQALTMQAWLALQKYPQQTPQILDWYGQNPEFQNILERFGPDVIPVIDYFITHTIQSLNALNAISQTATSIAQESKSMWNNLTGSEPTKTLPDDQPTKPPSELTPEQRGWAAIHDIRLEGNHFLGQFDIDNAGNAHWNTTDRITQDVGRFLTSGIADVERKQDLNEQITAADIGWAAVDALPVIAGLKLLKLGKVGAQAAKESKAATASTKTGKLAAKEGKTAKSATKTGLIERTGLLARGLAPSFLRKAAWLATAYIVITHPELLSSLFVQLGNLLGAPAWLSLLLGWTSVFYILLFPFIWLLEKMLRYAVIILGWLSPERRRVIQSVQTDRKQENADH